MVNTDILPVSKLRGVGPQLAKHLARLEIHSIQDLLFHLPLRYQDRTHVESIRTLTPNKEAVIEGEIRAVVKPTGGRTKLLCELHDGTGKISLRFFHVFPNQLEILQVGERLRCYGDVRWGVKGFEMFHPEFHIADNKLSQAEEHLTPIYPATEGLSQNALRKLTANALTWMQNQVSLQELLPFPLLQKFNFPSLKEALQFVHRPPNTTAIQDLIENQTMSQQRLVFEELLAHRISLLRVKQNFQMQKGISLLPYEKLIRPFLQSLSFTLTNAQQRVVKEIQSDLEKPFPMLRLVQGDVGSGKTVVAALAMLQAVENGYQAAMMAPTELLAEQHYRVFKRWLEPLGIRIVFLSGNIKGQERTAVLNSMMEGEAQIILGTHALFQEGVSFKNLALVIVDEQHRFGVEQRASFRRKGMQADYFPHQLIMTATPIPRTLAMSFYADLDCSVIDELPPGRTPISTVVLSNTKREEVMLRIKEACTQGKQVYWVCPLIEESEVLNCQAATKAAEQLQQFLSDAKVGLVHGRLSAKDKDAVMQQFKDGQIHLLVATTVIEVGVDVPNASLMIIENAERLGLSQLHQLRGRVGRGSIASHCVLLYQYPLSSVAKERLNVMRETTDGFKIAQRDLELRGPGEVLGTQQTGDITFHVADLLRDSEILTTVNEAADLIMQNHPEIIEPLTKRWLGKEAEYGKV